MIAPPGLVDALKHRAAAAGGDAVVIAVKADSGRVACADRQRGRSLGRIVEAQHLVEPHGSDLGGDQPQRPTRFNGGELPRVAEQAYDGSRVAGGAGQRPEPKGVDHAGLVHQDHVAGT